MLLAIALTLSSFITIEHIKYAFLADRENGIAGILRSVRPVDIVLGLVDAALASALFINEWRTRGLSQLLSYGNPGWQILALLSLLLWCSHVILLSGLLVVGDSGSHVARVAHLSMALQKGVLPYWDNYFFGGGLLLQNTGPVFHWLAAPAALLTGDATAAVKLTVFLSRISAGVFMYCYLRRTGLRPGSVFLGAFIFAGAFYMTYIDSIRGTFPQQLHLALFAATLFCIEGVLRQRCILCADWFGLCLASVLMIGNHQPTALMGGALLSIYVAFRLWQDRNYQALRPLAAASITILLGALYFLLPFALEKSWSAEPSENTHLIGLALPSMSSLFTYLRWGHGGTGPDYSAYLGYVSVGLALAGAVGWRPGAGEKSAGAKLLPVVAVPGLVSLVLVGALVRPTVYTFTFVAIAAACGADILESRLPRVRSLIIVLTGIAVLDNFVLAMQPYNRADLEWQAALGHRLAAITEGARVLEVTASVPRSQTGRKLTLAVGPGSTPLQYGRVAMLYGPHKLDATKAHNAMVAAIDIAALDLRRDGKLAAPTRALLAQYNVGWVIGYDLTGPGLPPQVAASADDPALGRYLRLSEATPVLAAESFTVTPLPAAFQTGPFWDISFDRTPPDPAAIKARDADLALTAAMKIDFTQRTAASFLVPALPHGADWPVLSSKPINIQLVSYDVDQRTTRVVVESNRPTLLRLAHPVFPGIDITRNGVPVSYTSDVFNLAVVPIVAGRNEIVVTVHPSALRRFCVLFTSLIIALLVIGLGQQLAVRPRVATH